ncbi:MAG: hypothetical protein RLZZ515_660 [Cyanobacteriota bacterium]
MQQSEFESLEALSEPARQALERGDYGRCQQLLAPLLEQHPASSPMGGQLRLLLATAQMGQGNSAAAAATCRTLRACRDASLRSQAKDLQEVLEAPALERPREWSMTLPPLGEVQPLEGQVQAMARRRRRQLPPPPPAPPTGPTTAPLGFAVVALVLLLITALLGGCVDVDTELRFTAPGRLQISQISQSSTGSPLPWQRQLRAELQSTPWRSRQDHGQLTLRAPALPAQQALDLLSATLERSADLVAVPLPEPQLSLQERNWLLGVRQHFACSIDLRGFEALPGLDLNLSLEPLPQRAVRLAEPLPVRALSPRKGHAARVMWRLQPGALNRLEVSCWRWSRLGVGAVLIGLLLALVALLQRLKLAAGFGLPQLPA